MRRKLVLIVAAASHLACTPSAPTTTASASAKEPSKTSGNAALSVVPSASAQGASALAPSAPRPSGSAPSPLALPPRAAARPADVVRCEAHSNAVFGSWTPTVDEVVAAISALPKKTCLEPATRKAAVSSCAAEVGTSLVLVSTDDLKGPSGCEVQIGAAEANGRKWISFFAFYRSAGAQFDGGARVVELTRTGPKLYLDALGKHGSLCPTTGGDPLKPHQLPEGWAAHPQQLKDFLCAGSK